MDKILGDSPYEQHVLNEKNKYIEMIKVLHKNYLEITKIRGDI